MGKSIFGVGPKFSHLLPNILVGTNHPILGVSDAQVFARASKAEAARLRSPSQVAHVDCPETGTEVLHPLSDERHLWCSASRC